MDALRTLPGAELAISARTRSILHSSPPPVAASTMLIAESDVKLPIVDDQVATLDDLCGSFGDAVARITRGAVAESAVEVREL